jgi:hypothetical protein
MTSPVKSAPESTEQLTYWQRFNRGYPSLMDAFIPDAFPTGPDPVTPTGPPSGPETVRQVTSHAARTLFGLRVRQYGPEAFDTTSPAAAEVNWKAATDRTTAAKTFGRNGSALMAAAKRLATHAETVEGNGEVNMLRTDANEHAYTIITRWHAVPKSVAPWLAKLGNHNVFRMLVNCFPAGGGELPAKATPPLKGIEPADAGDRAAIDRYRVSQWRENRPFGGLVPLGLSSMIWSRHYQEIFDEDSGLLVRCSPFATSGYHVLDGHLTWLLIVDTRNNRVMYAAVGGGSHPLRYVDQVNPIAGGMVMSVMMRTFARVLNAVPDGPNPMLDDRPTFRTLNEYIHRVDPELAVQRNLLELADRLGIPASEARRAHGGNVTDE